VTECDTAPLGTEQPLPALNRHVQTLDVAEMYNLDGGDGGLDPDDTAIYCRRLMQFCDTDLSEAWAEATDRLSAADVC
jgi:hypothetical protein